jgi:hypothetical protein
MNGASQQKFIRVTVAGKKIIGELAEWYCTGLLSQGWGNTQTDSIPVLSALINEALAELMGL